MEPALFRLDYISKYTQNMDILATLVREERIKLLVDKKRSLWLQEEKDKEAGVGQPISFNGDGDEDWLDLLIETDSEDDDEEEAACEVEEQQCPILPGGIFKVLFILWPTLVLINIHYAFVLYTHWKNSRLQVKDGGCAD